MEPSKAYLLKLFKESGIELDPERLDLFWRFHCLLREKSRELDLTRIYNFENMVIKHYVDSAIVTKLIDLPPLLLDLGTGAGFPGIPIKIMRPDISLTLMDTRQERIDFLKGAVQSLGLRDVEVIKKKLTGPIGKRFKGVITRALEDIKATLIRVSEVVEPGGLVIFMKGPQSDKELEEAKASMGALYKVLKDIPYRIPNTPYERRLLVFQRNLALSVEHKVISSPENKSYKLFKSLLSSKGIEKNRLFLMWGERFVKETLQRHRDSVEEIIIRQGGPYPEYLSPDIPTTELSVELFKELDPFGTGPPILVLRQPNMEPFIKSGIQKPLLAIPFQDPANVGAVIRTAAAMGIKRVILLKSSANPLHPRSVRAAGPYVLDMNFFGKLDMEEVRSLGLPVIGLAPPPKGRDLFRFRFPEEFVLLPGLEGPGLLPGVVDEVISIPMEPPVESLNAAMATGMVLLWWRYNRTKGLQRPPQREEQGV